MFPPTLGWKTLLIYLRIYGTLSILQETLLIFNEQFDAFVAVVQFVLFKAPTARGLCCDPTLPLQRNNISWDRKYSAHTAGVNRKDPDHNLTNHVPPKEGLVPPKEVLAEHES